MSSIKLWKTTLIKISRFLPRSSASWRILRGLLIFAVIFGWIFSGFPRIWQKPPIPPKIQKAQAANTLIRQEINITDAYLGSASGAYATSSAIIQIDTAQYTSPTYRFEAVASTTSSLASNIYLKNATTFAIVATIAIPTLTTSYTRLYSAFTPTSGANNYVVVMGNEAVQKGAIATRIVILQNAATLSNTETQIEIGSNVIATSSIVTTPMSNPKYWYYDSSKWDPLPTFYAEVTYRDYQVASTTTYTTATTTTTNTTYVASRGVSYVQVEAWGGGAGGGAIATDAGGGGGGGGYAKSIFAISAGTSKALVIGRGGAVDVLPGTATAAASSTYDGGVVLADAGGGTNSTARGYGGIRPRSPN
ncbi:MAG: hypothetical protein LiPW39_130 [Parcubacteria group bacterium LiPW_39]|nr:MAG: hypothetical protein LiPW39_130 [Parcubacteria group bacterium LiPW_39]